MSAAKAGDTVQVHYTGKLENGSVFDKLDANHPLAGKELTFDIHLVAIAAVA
jgi:FKBP-type peptidyl-prolyl cis-trans isomerase 2